MTPDPLWTDHYMIEWADGELTSVALRDPVPEKCPQCELAKK
jgi:hypothetical protein